MSKSFLLASTFIAVVADPAFAQTAEEPAAPPAGAPSAVEEIVVTGSRLRLSDYTLPNPVVSIGSESLVQSGAVNLGEYLQDIPALTNSLDLAEGADTETPELAGLNLLNLRNLGTVRTLVLVNGRRHVSANPGTPSVDVNTIPVALIDRVEVLTGGASAVYGADGVSGVVNFILKDDFEGVDIRAQKGWSEQGGAAETYVSGLIGHNFLEGRANLTLGVEYAKEDELDFEDRDYTRTGQRRIIISNPDDPGTFDADEDDPNIPDNIVATNVRYIDTSPGGSIYTNFRNATTTAGVSFLGNGDPFVDGVYAGEFFMIGGSGSPLDAFNDDLLPGLDRIILQSTGSFELTPKATLFGELKFARTETGFTAQPSYDYGLFIDRENPFIPAAARADARARGGLIRQIDGVLLARDNFDLGRQTYDIQRDTYRGVVGLRGDFTDNIEYEVSLVYGRAEQQQHTTNVRLNDRYFAATDVVEDPNTGEFVCRSDLDPTAVPVGDYYGQFAFPASAFGSTFTPGPNSGCIP